MKYPYLLFNQKIKHGPVFPHLTGNPFVADLSYQNEMLAQIDVRDQRSFQETLDCQMAPDYKWGFAGYLERRDSLLRDCPQMVEENRFYHLGLDVIAPLGTQLHAPLDAQVADAGYEAGDGNYGGYVLLKHEGNAFEPFYSFYGHLSRNRLPKTGQFVRAREVFGSLGDFHENGNWFYHTHIQVITESGMEKGYAAKGYCSEADLSRMNEWCPSPVILFRR